MMKLSVRGDPKDFKKFNLTHAGGGGMLAGPPLTIRSNPTLQHSARLTTRRVNKLESIIERGETNKKNWRHHISGCHLANVYFISLLGKLP